MATPGKSPPRKSTKKHYRSKRSGARVSKKIFLGNSRKTAVNKFRCSRCGKYFSSISEVNKHYSARGHTKAKPKRKKIVVKQFHEFSPEQQERAVLIANLISDKRAFQAKIREALEKFKNGGRRW